ncbi:MAG: hypothetical protein MJA83_10815, partial [Gammaproteobacteria bacterium]|nr:hypothetical protein [Gammaproteobacteria bacterium]
VLLNDDGTIDLDQDLTYHLSPDGTGVAEFKNRDANGRGLSVFSSSKVCWDIDQNGFLVRNRVQNLDSAGNRGQLPPVSLCSGLQQSRVWFSRAHDLFDRLGDGVTIQTMLLEFQNPCGIVFGPNPACEPLTLNDIFPAEYEFAPFSAVPAIPIDDFESTVFDTPVTIDVLANDIPGDLAIDAGSLVIDNGPFEILGETIVREDGTASIDGLNRLVFTPDASNSTDRDVHIEYRVSDIEGNQSIAGIVLVHVLSMSVPPPTFFSSPASLSDLHTVGDDPCSDPISTLSIGSSSGGNLSITGIDIIGDIHGFIDALARAPGSEAPNQLVDVSFNCASADDAIRGGDIVIDVVDIDTGFTSSVTVPVTHEVTNPPPPVLVASPASLTGTHFVGSSPCPDPLGTVQINSSDGADIQITGISVVA